MGSLPDNTLFITGTDTGVGKTYVCARLMEYLAAKDIRTGYQKWVATGAAKGLPEDLVQCLEAAGITPDPDLLEKQVPYSFSYSASPHLAAEMEGRSVDPEYIVAKYTAMAAGCEWLIVEGVGGVMVPLRRDMLLADLLARLLPKTLVVARSGLGTLNHTLLTLECLRRRKVPLLGVVFSDSEAREDERLVEDNMRTIAEIGLVRVFGRLQRLENAIEAKRAFMPVGQSILEELRHANP